MTDLIGALTDTAVYARPTPSAEAWFAGGERVGYDPNARAIVAAQDAPLKIFLSREGDLAQAVSFLPGFPDGSFGWAKVRPHLPNAAEMPKLFLDYVGMGDSDKPKDYAYSTVERTDLVEAIWRVFYLAGGAGFVADHKVQGDRLDFSRLFKAYSGKFPFLVGGSDEDPFERRQVDLAQERLGKLGLQIERLPGGHLTTNEQPEALAALIAKFELGLAKMPGQK